MKGPEESAVTPAGGPGPEEGGRGGVGRKLTAGETPTRLSPYEKNEVKERKEDREILMLANSETASPSLNIRNAVSSRKCLKCCYCFLQKLLVETRLFTLPSLKT